MPTLRELREAKGMTAPQLARVAGVHHRTIYLVENGTQIPRIGNMWKIADALGTVPLGISEFARAMTDRPESDAEEA